MSCCRWMTGQDCPAGGTCWHRLRALCDAPAIGCQLLLPCPPSAGFAVSWLLLESV
jgi:hypothetical protein